MSKFLFFLSYLALLANTIDFRQLNPLKQVNLTAL